MHVESQGREPVCFLATVAALSGRPLAEVKAYALKHARLRKWRPGRRRGLNVLRYWEAGIATARHFGGDDLANLMAPGSGSLKPLMPCQIAKTIPEKGRGVVTIRNARNQGHVAAWENGRIYDSDADFKDRMDGMTLEKFLKYRGGDWHVESIRILPSVAPAEDLGF